MDKSGIRVKAQDQLPDWHANLLAKYIAYVRSTEGTDYLDRLEGPWSEDHAFTEEEVRTLRELAGRG